MHTVRKVLVMSAVALSFISVMSCAPGLVKNSTGYITRVDQDQPISEVIKSGQYDWLDESFASLEQISEYKYETNSEVIQFEVVRFGGMFARDYVTFNEVLSKLETDGLRPATLRELIIFDKTWPDEQRKYTITALGSIFTSVDGHHVAQYVDTRPCKKGMCRGLYLEGGDARQWWFTVQSRRFLAVRK